MGDEKKQIEDISGMTEGLMAGMAPALAAVGALAEESKAWDAYAGIYTMALGKHLSETRHTDAAIAGKAASFADELLAMRRRRFDPAAARRAVAEALAPPQLAVVKDLPRPDTKGDHQ